MKIEPVKLSPKKGGNGYTSSYSVSIGINEAKDCGLGGAKKIIKIIDEENGTITFKVKGMTFTNQIINEVIRLKEKVHDENKRIDLEFEKAHGIVRNDDRAYSAQYMAQQYLDELAGIIQRPERKNYEEYLLNLPIECLADLVLLMYMGRDYDVKMDTEPGEERFIEFYSRYGIDVTFGLDKKRLAWYLIDKGPVPEFLTNGLKVLYAPKGTDIDSIRYGSGETNGDYDDYIEVSQW